MGKKKKKGVIVKGQKGTKKEIYVEGSSKKTLNFGWQTKTTHQKFHRASCKKNPKIAKNGKPIKLIQSLYTQ